LKKSEQLENRRTDIEKIEEIDGLLHHATDLDQQILLVTEDLRDNMETVDFERPRVGLDRVAVLVQQNASAHDAARRLLRELDN
jgi:hypothetical protein